MSTTGNGMLHTVLHTVADSHVCAKERSIPIARTMISCIRLKDQASKRVSYHRRLFLDRKNGLTFAPNECSLQSVSGVSTPGHKMRALLPHQPTRVLANRRIVIISLLPQTQSGEHQTLGLLGCARGRAS